MFHAVSFMLIIYLKITINNHINIIDPNGFCALFIVFLHNKNKFITNSSNDLSSFVKLNFIFEGLDDIIQLLNLQPQTKSLSKRGYRIDKR